ncbi:MAG: DUF3108 domain-containing protein [Bacteroidaceae bacterium]|nr:DUF3108 domain-containing protein [Bacteroidaceae bacterium]
MISGHRSIILSLLILSFTASSLDAQDISYNLYFSVGFVNVNAGKARLTEKVTTYEGQSARMTRLTMTTGRATDRIFALRDTIESFNSLTGQGIFYRKTVNEGAKHNIETASFSVQDGQYVVDLLTKDAITGRISGKKTEKRTTRIFDMLSMLTYARSIDKAGKEKGYTSTLPMVNGDMVVEQYLVYEGDKTVKADDKKKYDCMVISVRDRKYGKERETLKAYVTKDSPHKPVQLDIIVGVASIRALLTE